jgi:hypothetical protein
MRQPCGGGAPENGQQKPIGRAELDELIAEFGENAISYYLGIE